MLEEFYMLVIWSRGGQDCLALRLPFLSIKATFTRSKPTEKINCWWFGLQMSTESSPFCITWRGFMARSMWDKTWKSPFVPKRVHEDEVHRTQTMCNFKHSSQTGGVNAENTQHVERYGREVEKIMWGEGRSDCCIAFVARIHTNRKYWTMCPVLWGVEVCGLLTGVFCQFRTFHSAFR